MIDTANHLLGIRSALLQRREQLMETVHAVREQIVEVDRQLFDCAAAARVFGVAWPEDTQPLGSTVKDAVLRCLMDSKETGCTSDEMRPIVERETGAAHHPKTIGMTLYRLKIDGLVQRSGHRWWLSQFFTVIK